jgi:prolipoprotein diacylglyceryltransferase
MIGDLLIFGVLLFLIFRLRRDGVAFFGMLLLYSLMRLGVSELRIDSRVVIAGLTVPQVTALFVIPPSFIGLIYCLRQKGETTSPEPARAKLAAATGPPAS